jgi:hypothetical protein
LRLAGTPPVFARQERGNIEVRRDPPSPAAGINLGGANAPVFLGDLVDAVFG